MTWRLLERWKMFRAIVRLGSRKTYDWIGSQQPTTTSIDEWFLEYIFLNNVTSISDARSAITRLPEYLRPIPYPQKEGTLGSRSVRSITCITFADVVWIWQFFLTENMKPAGSSQVRSTLVAAQQQINTDLSRKITSSGRRRETWKVVKCYASIKEKTKWRKTLKRFKNYSHPIEFVIKRPFRKCVFPPFKNNWSTHGFFSVSLSERLENRRRYKFNVACKTEFSVAITRAIRATHSYISNEPIRENIAWRYPPYGKTMVTHTIHLRSRNENGRRLENR